MLCEHSCIIKYESLVQFRSATADTQKFPRGSSSTGASCKQKIF